MLNALRRASKGFLAKILIAILVLSFAVWGVSGFVNQVDRTEVARVGDTPVRADEFARLYRAQINRLSQQSGTVVTPAMAEAQGLSQQILQVLVSEALQVDAARALGVDFGDETIAERIRNDPAFAGPDGDSFSRDRFDRVLASNAYTERDYIARERRAAAQEAWVSGLVGGLTAPAPYLEALNRFTNQTRRVTWLRISDEAIGPIADPSEETLRAFHEANAGLFRTPERRTLSVVTLTPETLAEPATVSERDVRRAYDTQGAYSTPERRHVQQVFLDDMETARKAAAALNEQGVAFSTLLGELDRRLEDVDLGLVERDGLIDPAVADAAFSLAEAGGAAAVDGRFGAVLVRVSAIEPAEKQPFEAVEAEIRAALAAEDAVDEIRTLHDSIEDAIAGGASVGEVAERFDLPLTVAGPVDRSGRSAQGETPAVPGGEATLAAAFAAESGDDAVPVRLTDGTAWVQTDSVVAAADRPFEEVAEEVLVAWTEAQKIERVAEAAAQALADLESGEPVEAVAERWRTEAHTSEPFSRATTPEDLPQAAANAAFEGPLGHAAQVPAPDGTHIVLKVTEVAEPVFFEQAADLAPVRRALDEGIAQSLLTAFIGAWQQEVGARMNPTVIDEAIGLNRERG